MHQRQLICLLPSKTQMAAPNWRSSESHSCLCPSTHIPHYYYNKVCCDVTKEHNSCGDLTQEWTISYIQDFFSQLKKWTTELVLRLGSIH